MKSDNRWARVSQDELGKSGAEYEFGRLIVPKNSRKKVILDRCNVTRKERKQWMDLGLNPKSGAIFFDVDRKECLRRVTSRTDHPTIPFGKGHIVVNTFSKRLEPPIEEEGFEIVHNIRNEDDMNLVLSQYGAERSAAELEFKQHMDAAMEGCPTLETIAAKLNLNPSKILNVYVYGSRLWGGYTSKSDWDFIIVLDDAWGYETTHFGREIDAHIMGREEYLDRLRQHKFLPILTLFIPNSHKLKELFDASAFFKIKKGILANSVMAEFERDIRVAKKHLAKSDVAKFKEIVVHSFRMILIASDIVNSGIAGSFYAEKVKSFGEELSYNFYGTEWDDYKLWLRKAFSPYIAILQK